MKIFTRVLCLVLIFVMMIPLLASCKKDPTGANGGDPAGNNNGSNPAGVVEGTDDKYHMERQDFGGRKIRFLGWTAAAQYEFEIDEEDANNTLRSALYTRNELVKEMLNVDFEWDYTRGHALFENDFVAEADRRLIGNSVDIITPYSRVGSLLMLQGLIQDMSKSEIIDFSKPWWSPGLVENGALYGKVYYAAGDISWSLMSETIAMCFNKTILSANAEILNPYGVDNMYDLVKQNKWTLQTMIQMSKAVTSDGDENTRTYGFAAHIGAMDAFWKGSDMKWLELSNDGALKVAEHQTSSRANELVATLTEFYRTSAAKTTMAYYDDSYIHANPVNKANPKCVTWNAGRSLFQMSPIVSITDYGFAELPFGFGMLPVPKYDGAQLAYKTTPGFEYSVCCIPRVAQGFDQLCAVLECMAIEGYNLTAPAYYSQTLRKQISDSAEDYAMWETIKNSIEMDTGRLFEVMGGTPWAAFRNALIGGKTNYIESIEGSLQSLETELNTINKTMRNMEKKFS